MAGDLHPGGLLVPVVTPFDARGAVDVDALGRLVHELLDAGAAGVVALGTAGEASALDDAERATVVACCAEACRDRDATLLVGAGTNDTRTTLARHEALADVPGVGGALTVVPYYVRPSEADAVRHLQLVAERSPVPVVAYNVPYRTGVGLGADALLELAATPNVVGVKQAVGGVDEDTLLVLAAAPEGFAVLCGDDPYILPLVLLGAAGAIAASANVATRAWAELVAAALRDDVEAARLQARALLPLARALFAEPSPAVMKAVLHAQGRIATPGVRGPLGAASPAALQRALACLPEGALR